MAILHFVNGFNIFELMNISCFSKKIKMSKKLISILLGLLSLNLSSSSTVCLYIDSNYSAINDYYSHRIQLESTNFNRPNPIFQLFRFKQKRNKRITAAALAFPFPFGIVALHRIYLGCQPHVPVVYIGSFGGVFGVLPFIDFVFLLSDKDIEKYNNKPGVFMWAD